MNFRWTLTLPALLLAAVTLLSLHPATAPTLQQAPRYTVTDLGTLGGNRSAAFGLNDTSQVAGYSYLTKDGPDHYHAFRYSGGVMTDIGTLGGQRSTATDINASGQVTGYSELQTGTTPHAFLYGDGNMQDLGTLPGDSGSYAFGINSLGQVVGASFKLVVTNTFLTSTYEHAFLYSNGSMQDLSAQLGGADSRASDINASGQVVGRFVASQERPGCRHAFLYSGGVMTDIGALAGTLCSEAMAINDSGVVTGFTNTTDGRSPRLFLYSNGMMQDLGSLGDQGGAPAGINSAGEIVGTYVPTGAPGRAFIYSGGALTDLNTLIPANSEWVLNSATDINNTGQIVGLGTVNGDLDNPHAFLLTPIDAAAFSITVEPSSLQITQGESGQASVTVTSGNLSGSDIRLTCSGLPAGVSCGFSPASVTPAAGGTAASALTVNVSIASPPAPGTYTFQVVGTSGQVSNLSNPVSLTIIDNFGYNISGRVTDLNGRGMSGVAVNLSGTRAVSTTTNSNGDYLFRVPAGGNYAVVPYRQGYSFTPMSRAFADLSADRAGANFTGTPGPSVAGVYASPSGGDFDGDGRTDMALWRASTSEWFILNSSNNSVTVRAWGDVSGDIPVAADYDGDKRADIAIFRPSDGGHWYIINSSNNSVRVAQWGNIAGDIPVPADYDGDGKADLAIFRPADGYWYIINSSNNSVLIRQWGDVPGDIPVPCDYDGDKRADLAIFRPANGGHWYVINSSTGSAVVQQWGNVPGDVPVPADYDGDGKADLAIFRPAQGGRWYIVKSSGSGWLIQQWGDQPRDIPVPGNYDVDGRADIAIWRAATGVWYIINSSTGAGSSSQWGQPAPGDVPVSASLVGRSSTQTFVP
ncbi:MAG TPA: FG-GAP-like repeat-containing protein [Pyrinomonadaceae bacterium]|jgi:probable HAF family extracellular repeat protein